MATKNCTEPYMTLQEYTGQYGTMKGYAVCMAIHTTVKQDAAISKTGLDTTIDDYARLYMTKYDQRGL